MSVYEKMTAIADEIRDLSNTTGKLGLDAMASNLSVANEDADAQAELIAQIGEAVKGKVLRDEFWDCLQNYGTRNNYDYLFQNSAFEYIDAKYPITDTKLYATFNNSKNLKGILCDAVPVNGTFSTLYIAFSGCDKLEEINFDLPVSGNASLLVLLTANY